MNIPFPLDERGAATRECPACNRRFKIFPGEGSADPIGFCPYCDQQGQQCWWTSAQAQYIEAKVAEIGRTKLENMVQESFKGLNSRSFKVTTRKTQPGPVARPPEEQNDLHEEAYFPCCGERILHDGLNETLFCVICGTETEGSGSPSSNSGDDLVTI